LSGEGRAFCAGIDLAELGGDPTAVARLLERPEGEIANRVQQATTWNWRRLPVPVIAALHGEVFGAGLQLALGADLRIAHPQSRLSVMEIRWGLVPDMGGSQTLRRLVRRDVALELTWTGRIVAAPEALALGLVTRLDAAPLEAALALAAEIAGRSPDAVRAAKRLFHAGWEEGYAAGLALEAELQSALIGAPNQREALRAGLAGEPPRFGPARG
jgi:enoyl-CoA hydratase/carnithine racemase